MLIWSKNSRLILRGNLIPTLECLIDVPPPQINFSIPPRSLFPPPSPPSLINYWGKFSTRVWNDILMVTFFARSQKEWPVCSLFCFATSCKDVNTIFRFFSTLDILIPTINSPPPLHLLIIGESFQPRQTFWNNTLMLTFWQSCKSSDPSKCVLFCKFLQRSQRVVFCFLS